MNLDSGQPDAARELLDEALRVGVSTRARWLGSVAGRRKVCIPEITAGGVCWVGPRAGAEASSFGAAIVMNHPLGEATEDAERWWQAYLLAENDQVDELRRLAAAGDDHARRQLAS